MPSRRRPEPTEQPSESGYAVFHERPYPHRLDRAFRVAAVVVATPVLAIGLVAAVFGFYASADIRGTLWLTAAGVIVSGMAYGFTRAVGIYGGTRPKAYVVDWDERPPR